MAGIMLHHDDSSRYLAVEWFGDTQCIPSLDGSAPSGVVAYPARLIRS
jgi:hypothetical protein